MHGAGGGSVETPHVVLSLPPQLCLQPSELEKEESSQNEVDAQTNLLAVHALRDGVDDIIAVARKFLRRLLILEAFPWRFGQADHLVVVIGDDLPKGTRSSASVCGGVLLEVALHPEVQGTDLLQTTNGGRAHTELQAAAIKVDVNASEVPEQIVQINELIAASRAS